MTKTALLLCFFLSATAFAFGQKPTDILATAKGHKFTVQDLSPETRQEIANAPEGLKKYRAALLNEMIAGRALALEADSKNITIGRLLLDVTRSLPAPTEAEIRATFEENSASLGGAALDSVRESIVAWLKAKARQEAVAKLAVELQKKFKSATVKDVNAADAKPADVLATLGTSKITRAEFDRFAAYELYRFSAVLADHILEDLDEAIFNALTTDEAKAEGVDASTIIAREITNKMVDFSDEEHARLSADLGKRLTTKYNVVLLYKAPEAPVEDVSPDDDPAEGPVNAPVTVIMFSDFQCSACSATHPILKKAIAAFPGKVRLVVRDFPLESIHENSLLAARAASAANAQGKFFDYIEILYKNQDKLDVTSLKKYAADLGLDAVKFAADMDAEKTFVEIKKDIADGESLNISSTPTIFVNGRRVADISEESFKEAIEQGLKK